MTYRIIGYTDASAEHLELIDAANEELAAHEDCPRAAAESALRLSRFGVDCYVEDYVSDVTFASMFND
jgi:hypothetical protein